MKIMIVDDHGGIRQMLRSFLAAPDTEVRECVDGAEAVAAYSEFQPDLVFMDNIMAELDGISATRQIVGAHPEAKVVLLAEEDLAQLRRVALAAGACGFVTKDHLFSGLREHAGRRFDPTDPLWRWAA